MQRSSQFTVSANVVPLPIQVGHDGEHAVAGMPVEAHEDAGGIGADVVRVAPIRQPLGSAAVEVIHLLSVALSTGPAPTPPTEVR